MIKGFEFEDGTRKYTCTVESPRQAPDDAWWWFAVSGDQQRYAPFRAESGDTRQSVRDRVVAFYENRLFQLTQPTVRGGHWARRQGPAAAPAAGAAPAVAAPIAQASVPPQAGTATAKKSAKLA